MSNSQRQKIVLQKVKGAHWDRENKMLRNKENDNQHDAIQQSSILKTVLPRGNMFWNEIKYEENEENEGMEKANMITQKMQKPCQTIIINLEEAFDLSIIKDDIINTRNSINQQTEELARMISNSLQKEHELFPEVLCSTARTCLEQMKNLDMLIKSQLGSYDAREKANVELWTEFNKTNIYLKPKDDYLAAYEDYAEFYMGPGNEVTTAQISPNEKMIAICQAKSLQIWDLQEKQMINTINYGKKLSAVNFYDDHYLGVGDAIGQISTLVDYQVSQMNHKIHKMEILSLIFKNKNQIISASKDNTIKLTIMDTGEIVRTIKYIYPCPSGFDYNKSKDIIIAPNYNYVSVWDSDKQLELMKSESFYDRRHVTFIQVQFSNDAKQALINISDQHRIYIVDIDMNAKLLTISYFIRTDVDTQNVSYCLSNKSILYITNRNYVLLGIEQERCQKIIGSKSVSSDRVFLNRQQESLNYLVSIFRSTVNVCKRMS